MKDLETIYQAARKTPAGEREAFLKQACAGDAPMLARISQMLSEAETTGEVFGQPATADPETPTILLGDGEVIRGAEAVGSVIGRYKLLDQVGEGGFGVVYVAEQSQPVRRRVALKVIKLGMDTKAVVARFEAERQALAMMDHPNIARVYDAGATETGRPYFVMELVSGVKITDYCDQARLSIHERLALFIKVCHAIQHAHQKGIIHRDIKPSNILVTQHDGGAVPKVIDFGIAKATGGRLTDSSVYTQLHEFIGTPIYMSPEQAEMSGLDIDTRSDIYSLGVLLYELLAGCTPFDAKELMGSGLDAMRRTIREQEPPRPSIRLATLGADKLATTARLRSVDTFKLVPQIQGDLDWIVTKCLEKDRKRRYDTANGLALDLQRHLRNEVVIACPPTPGYLLGKFIRRNKLPFAAGAGIAMSLLVGIAVSTWQAVRAERESRRASATLGALRATAPAFAAQARALVAQEHFEEALEKLRYAAQLQPETPDYWLAIGDLLQCQMKFSAAATAYRTALPLAKADGRAQRHAELCDNLEAARLAAGGELPRAPLANLFEVMTRERRTPAELMPVARLLGQEGRIALDFWRQRLSTLPIAPDRPLESRLTVRPDGLLKLDLAGTEITDLLPLTGMPVAELDLSSCRKIQSLAPLRDLPLKSLYLGSTDVADLAPLRGMPLETLSLANTRITDLSSLAGLPLKHLDCSNLPATDYGVLARAPLESLILSGARIRDARFLDGLPLQQLSLAGANDVRHLEALPRLKSLNTLILPHNFHEFPAADLEAVQSVVKLPSLQRVSSSRADDLRLSAVGTRESFLQEWAGDLRWLHELRKTGVEPSLLRLPDRTWEVDLRDQPLRDLSSLAGAPLSKLVLFNVAVKDLRPLSGMPLRVLDLRRTEVNDLSPVKGMPLRELYLWRVKAPDFSVLTTLPDLELLDVSETEFRDLRIIASRKLRELRMGGSRITDLAPLAGLPLERLHADSIAVSTIGPLLECPSLKWVIPPRAATNLARLKSLPQLERISFRWREGSEPIDTAAQFWKTHAR